VSVVEKEVLMSTSEIELEAKVVVVVRAWLQALTQTPAAALTSK
jgi:hypothetical protein